MVNNVTTFAVLLDTAELLDVPDGVAEVAVFVVKEDQVDDIVSGTGSLIHVDHP